MNKKFKRPMSPDNYTKIDPNVVTCPKCGILFVKKISEEALHPTVEDLMRIGTDPPFSKLIRVIKCPLCGYREMQP